MVEIGTNPAPPRLLLVDDEDQFRSALRRQLELRGFAVDDAGNGMRALELARANEPEVVVLDENMPGMDGLETLAKLKKIRPRAQVIMLTGHSRTGLPEEAAAIGLFHFLEKPCGLDDLLSTIDAARDARFRAEPPPATPRPKFDLRRWVVGAHGRRPGLLVLSAALFAAAMILPEPGWWPSAPTGVSWALARAGLGTMVAVVTLLATGALPVGMVGLVAAAVVGLTLAPDWQRTASLLAREPAVFFFSMLAVTAAASRSGLDRRLGLRLLWLASGRAAYLFLFLPLFALAGAFLPEQALVAVMAPVVLSLYDGSLRGRGLREDRGLGLTLLLGLAFAANIGALGTPLGGGRNLIALDLFPAAGGLGFGGWVKFGLPTVIALCLPVSAYLYFVFGRSARVVTLAAGEEVGQRLDSMSKMTDRDWFVAAVVVALLAVLILLPDRLGLAAPALVAVLVLHLGGALRWKDIQRLHWDLVLLYAGLMAVSVLVAESGAAAWVAHSLGGALDGGPTPTGALLATLAANLVGPAAAVTALGPAAARFGSSALLSVAFGAALAHIAVFATSANAIVYVLGKDPATGERLVGWKDFLKHGLAATALNLATLWLLGALGWWRLS